MGNGVSGKASANLKTIYLEVDGRKHKVIGRTINVNLNRRWAIMCLFFCYLIFHSIDLITLTLTILPLHATTKISDDLI